MDIGPRLRAIRQDRGYTLARLTELSGVSQAMLSDIECGKKCPTLKTVQQIAIGLNMSIGDLLQVTPTPRINIVRADQRSILVDPEFGYERHDLAPTMTRRGIEVVLYRIPPGMSPAEFLPDRPGTMEVMHVIHGRLRALAGAETIELSAGDTLTLESDVDHRLENLSPDEWLEFILVVDSTRVGR
ncbi:MAG: helix-turn-helix domain-containing protein [Phycisphaerales bacterium]